MTNLNCPICLEDKFTNPVTTRCGHIYCYSCLHDWIQSSSSCPVCNNSIELKDCIRIHGVPEKDLDTETAEATPKPPRAEYVPHQQPRVPQQVYEHPFFQGAPGVRMLHHAGPFPFSFSFQHNFGTPGVIHHPYVQPTAHQPRPANPREARKQMIMFFVLLFLFAVLLQFSEIVFI
ncbi:hypothetical protein RCL1_008893 [Eukaryota sp. TZLM3-RCL]